MADRRTLDRDQSPLQSRHVKLLVATANAHKVEEIRQILKDYPVQLADLRDFPSLPVPEETGADYLANARLKAHYYGSRLGMVALSDDSGLEVDALDGAPGLYSARFGGEHLPHSEKILLVLERLQGLPEAQRTARFRCCSVIVDPSSGREWACEETCEGHIAPSPRGEQGFGYDPIFLVGSGPQSMAELSSADKHAVSHRGKSLRGLLGLYLPSIHR